MRARSGWWRRLAVPLVACATGVAMAGTAALPSAAAQTATVKTVPVQQLSNRVEKLIKVVEGSTLACPTRNMVVRRLRALDDALLSGRRSAARAFVQAWMQDAWSMEAARVLGPELGSSLQTRLGGMADQIGVGWPVKRGPARHWRPLPSCESGVSVGSYTPDVAVNTSADIEALVKGLVRLVPRVGYLLSALVGMLWPGESETNAFQQLVTAAVYDLVSGDLNGLEALLTGYPGSWETLVGNWQGRCETAGWDSQTCINEANDTLWTNFQDINHSFILYGPDFQLNGSADYRLDLLPIYAQYMNLYLGFLRDGVLLHNEYWANAGKDPDNLAKTSMAQLLDPSFVNDHGVADRGIGYVNSIYNMGLPPQPKNADEWITRNTYIRNMTLEVLDFRDTWKYLDPDAYPEGVPGGVKLTRMIYSDPVGHPMATPQPPSMVPGPLRELSVWTAAVDQTQLGPNIAISSVQATGPPTLGPATSGPVTAGTVTLPNSASYYSLSARGPIVKVSGQIDKRSPFYYSVPTGFTFTFADGSESTSGGWNPSRDTTTKTYDGEVLATAQVVSKNTSDPNYDVADAVVFGFRYADSFDPAGEAIGVASSKCIDLPSWTDGTQAVIHSCYQPSTPGQVWTYDPGLQQLSVTNPAVDPADNPDNTQSKYCLDTAGGGTSAGTKVVVNACDDGAQSGTTVSSQRWALEAVPADHAGFGKITNVKSGLVIDVPNNSTADGTGLQLNTYVTGAIGQVWQLHDPSTGEIHGIGSGRCVDVPNGSTTKGTQVQIYDCNGTAAQQWTYNPANKELIYAMAPSMCLEARDGGTTDGTPVQLNGCTGAAGQQWTLNGDGSWISNIKSGLVLDTTDGATANGTRVQLYTSNGTQGQQWSRTSTQGGALRAITAGKCLDLPSWSNGTQAVIGACSSNSASQVWVYHPLAQTFTVTSPSGPKCLDAQGGTTVGTAVVINDCTGAASQQWSLDFANLSVTNVNSGLVLSTGTGLADGSPVQLSSLGTVGTGWVWSPS